MKRNEQTIGAFTNDVARDIADLRKAASGAEGDLRTLRELEMGWVAGGDGGGVWPV